MDRRATNWGWFLRATLALCAIFSPSFFAPLFAQSNNGQIAAVLNDDGRRFFVNAEPPAKINLTAPNSRPNIYLPEESSCTGPRRPAFEIRRDGDQKLTRASLDRPRLD